MSDVAAAIEAASTSAGEFASLAAQAADMAAGAFANIQYPEVSWSIPYTSFPGFTPVVPPAPTLALTPPTPPAITDPQAPLAMTLPAPPTPPTGAPSFTMPTLPTASLPTAPSPASAPTMPTMPTAPTLSMPAALSLSDITIPAVPQLVIPTYTPDLLSVDLPPPTTSFSFAEQPFQSALLDELKVKLMNDLVNGGYGIEPADEISLWSREADREYRATAAAQADISRQFAARGFAAPVGAMMAALQASTQATLEKLSAASRDIALKRADMYVDNRKFTIQQTKDTVQMLMNYFGFMQERALNAAKASVEMSIAVYNAGIARLHLLIERERTRAQVFDSQLKAALAPIEVFKAQVEGAMAQANVQRAKVDVYRAQYEGLRAQVELYSAQVGATNAALQVEALKMQIYKNQVEIFVAQVGAYEAQFRAYGTQVQAATTPLIAYKAQVEGKVAETQAYAAQVGAEKTKKDAEIANAQLLLKAAEIKLEGYRGQLEALKFTAQQNATSYHMQSENAIATNQVLLKAIDSNVAVQKANAELAIESARTSANVAATQAQVATAVAEGIGRVNGGLAAIYSQAAASALSSAQAIAAEITVN